MNRNGPSMIPFRMAHDPADPSARQSFTPRLYGPLTGAGLFLVWAVSLVLAPLYLLPSGLPEPAVLLLGSGAGIAILIHALAHPLRFDQSFAGEVPLRVPPRQRQPGPVAELEEDGEGENHRERDERPREDRLGHHVTPSGARRGCDAGAPGR